MVAEDYSHFGYGGKERNSRCPEKELHPAIQSISSHFAGWDIMAHEK